MDTSHINKVKAPQHLKTRRSHRLHRLLVLNFPSAHVRDFFFERLDQIQVVVRDVVIIVLDLRKGLLVRRHQLLDMNVLLALDRAAVLLALLLQRFPNSFRLRFVLLLDLGPLPRELLSQIMYCPIMSSLERIQKRVVR